MTKREKEIVHGIRKYHCGYIGSQEFVDKATDKEILELVKINDRHAELHNLIMFSRPLPF